MAQNDAKIKELLKTVEEKRAKLGTRPKAVLRSNGAVYVDDTVVNLNTINAIPQIVTIVAKLLSARDATYAANKFLGLEDTVTAGLEDQLEDLKLRASILQWEIDKKKLTVLETKLKDLRSEDARTADALDDILGELK